MPRPAATLAANCKYRGASPLLLSARSVTHILLLQATLVSLLQALLSPSFHVIMMSVAAAARKQESVYRGWDCITQPAVRDVHSYACCTRGWYNARSALQFARRWNLLAILYLKLPSRKRRPIAPSPSLVQFNHGCLDCVPSTIFCLRRKCPAKMFLLC